MQRKIRIFTLLAVMIITAGQAWADAPQPGYINYDDQQTMGGYLRFFSTEAAAFANETGISARFTSGKSDAQYSGTIYIRALHFGHGYTVNGMTITVTPSGGGDITVTPVEGHVGVYQFDMPTDGSNVTVTAVFAANPAVATTYIDADGTEKTVDAYPLDGAEDQLNFNNWYVARDNVACDHTLYITGDNQDNVHVILADGCNMTVTAPFRAIEFYERGLTLSIYGQSGGTGSLTATGTGDGFTYGISNNTNTNTAVIINGGRVTAKGSSTGIEATNVTINGGQVTATGSNGINAINDITINGGQVTANGDINAENITLGWKNATDFIKASRYYTGTVKTAVKNGKSQRFVIDDKDNNTTGISKASDEAVNLSDYGLSEPTTLRPLDGYLVAIPEVLNISCKETPDYTINGYEYDEYSHSHITITRYYYKYQKDEDMTLSLPNYGQNGVELSISDTQDHSETLDLDVAIANNKATVSYKMGGDDLFFKKAKYYNTGVKFMTWDDTKKELVEATTPENTKVYILDGSEKGVLGDVGATATARQFSSFRASRRDAPVQSEYWYIVKDIKDGADVAYTDILAFGGDTHLILADGAEMTVTIKDKNEAITTNNDLTIHGQTEGTGTLNVEHTQEDGSPAIYSKNITINGCIVNVEGTNDGIFAFYDIAINGGQVTAITTGNGNHGINSGNSDITLGWSKDTDFIKASSYKAGNGKAVKTASGKHLKAYTPAATANDADKPFAYIASNHTFTADELTVIAGKKLKANPDGLTYMAWNDDQKKLIEMDTATDEIADNDIVYVLQGTEEYLGMKDNNDNPVLIPGTDKPYVNWYICNSENLSYGKLIFYCDAHLILADGSKMSCTNTDQTSLVSYCDFNIYGQNNQTGTMTITTNEDKNNDTSYSFALAGNLTINGGVINVSCSNGNTNKAIKCDKNITINGGIVNATSEDLGIAAYGIITINGGQVPATGRDGIYSENGDIILGWNSATDFIKASSYKVYNAGKTVKTAAGQRFIAYNMASDDDISINCIIGETTNETTLDAGLQNDIAGKTLRPLAVDEIADDGTKTTYPGYWVSAVTGVTLSGKTAPDFTYTTDAGTENEKTTPCYMYKANDEITLGVAYKDCEGVYEKDGNAMEGNTISMGTNDVKIGLNFITGQLSNDAYFGYTIHEIPELAIAAGTLKISGNGAFSSAPWKNFAKDYPISAIVIDMDGVELGLPANAFSGTPATATLNNVVNFANTNLVSFGMNDAEGNALNTEGFITDLDTDAKTATLHIGDWKSQAVTLTAKLDVKADTDESIGQQYMTYSQDVADCKVNSTMNPNVTPYAITYINLATGVTQLTPIADGAVAKDQAVIFVTDAPGGFADDGVNMDSQTGAAAAAVESNTEAAGPLSNFIASDGKTLLVEKIKESLNLTAETPKEIIDGILLFALKYNKFVRATYSENSKGQAHGAYLAIPKNYIFNEPELGLWKTGYARTIHIDLGNETGISGPTPDRPTPDPSLYGGEWYDLQGRKLDMQPTEKGVYIQGGKKRVMK